MYRSSQSTIRNAQPVRSNARRSWATISSRVWVSQGPSARVVSRRLDRRRRDLLEQLERGRLGGRRADLAASEVLELREEGRVDGDLLGTGVLEDDHRPARHARRPSTGLVPERGARRRQHRDRELAPVRDRVLALGGVHLRQVVVVALRQSGDRRLERRLGEQVVRCGHVAQYGAALVRVEHVTMSGPRMPSIHASSGV